MGDGYVRISTNNNVYVHNVCVSAFPKGPNPISPPDTTQLVFIGAHGVAGSHVSIKHQQGQQNVMK